MPALLLSAAFAAAQTAEIRVDGAKRFATFVREGLPTDDLSTDIQFADGQATSVTLPAGGTLYVWNLDTGNLAAKPVSAVGKKWSVAAKEFNRISLVSVRVEYKGEPVSAARVVLKDKAREQSQILDSSAKGELDFYVVQPGAVTVRVEYRSEGAAADPVVQQFNLELRRKSLSPLLTIAVPNKVETIGSGVSATGATLQSSEPPRSRANPIGTIIVFLVTLVFGGALVYGLYHLAKKNQTWVKGKMQQLGVDVPEPPQQVADDTQPVPDLVPAKPQASSKIILDDGAMPPAPVSTSAAVQTVVRDPKLVRSNGDVSSFDDGETVVGREAGLGLSLVGEDSVSRRHASITRRGLQLSVKDLGSTNGTFVNGRKISAETTLSPGDDVQFGAVKFRVENR